MEPAISPEAAHAPGEGPAFDLKGAVSALAVLRLRTTDAAHIERELLERVERAQRILVHAPVVIDVGALDGEAVARLELPELVAALTRCRVLPVAVTNLDPELAPRAAAAGLGLLSLGPPRPLRDGEGGGARDPRAAAPPAAGDPGDDGEVEIDIEEEAAAAPAAAPTMVLRQTVRGGQVVYARRGDLVVLAPVNPGAQIIADGHIHVYGPLRGVALAGAAGDPEARIFCQSLRAEIVSVAGEYLSADEIPETLRARPAQILLDGGRCRAIPL